MIHEIQGAVSGGLYEAGNFCDNLRITIQGDDDNLFSLRGGFRFLAGVPFWVAAFVCLEAYWRLDRA